MGLKRAVLAAIFVGAAMGAIPARAATPDWHGNNPSPAGTVAIEATPSGNGYLLLDAAGGVFAYGDAQFHGSVPELRHRDPRIGQDRVVDIALTKEGDGYWVLDESGGIFAFGGARYWGSVPELRRRGVRVGPGRVIDLAPVGDRGYYLLDEHGGVFAFGDVPFYGSIPGLRRQGAAIGSAVPASVVPDGTSGYWMLDRSGGVFAFGAAPYLGSLPGDGCGPCTAVAMRRDARGEGYYILQDWGFVSRFGAAYPTGQPPWLGPGQAVAMAVHPDGGGAWIATGDGRVFAVAPSVPPPAPSPAPPDDSDTSVSFTDPVGDVAYCKGDIEEYEADYGSEVTVGVDLACGSNPHDDVEWVEGLTGPEFDLDVDGDGLADYFVWVENVGEYSYTVYRIDDGEVTCEGQPWWNEADRFGATFSADCIGDPASFTFSAFMDWEDDPTGSGGFDVDLAPDTEELMGPVARP